MREFISIQRKGHLGTVRYNEDGHTKGAKFDPAWPDAKVLEHFGITKPETTKPKESKK